MKKKKTHTHEFRLNFQSFFTVQNEDNQKQNCVTAIYDKSQTYRPVRASRVEKRAGQAGHGLYTQTPLNWR